MRRLLALAALPCLMAAGPPLERIVIDDDFPAGYQVEVADVNGDGKPDIVGLGGGTCAWYENPTWRKRIITGPDRTPDIISSATADIDGDGKAEIAIAYDFAMNEPKRGKLLLAVQGKGPDDPWEVGHVADVPSIHRLRWFNRLEIGGNSIRFVPVAPGRNPPTEKGGRFEGARLVVSPLFGPSARPPIYDQEPAQMLLFTFSPHESAKPHKFLNPAGNTEPKGNGGLGGSGGGVAGIGGDIGDGGLVRGMRSNEKPVAKFFGKWEHPNRFGPMTLGTAAVTHAIDVTDPMSRDQLSIYSASNLGVTKQWVAVIAGAEMWRTMTLVPGAAGDAPKKGASEVHLGKLKDGRRFLTTVEPWHGTDVAVYLTGSAENQEYGPRMAIDTTLVDGHALWVADIDGDGDDEIFAGYRGGKTGVNLYRRDGETWTKTVVDDAIAAQDLRGGDIDGDGRPDIVAIGGKTHNVVWYRPIGRP